MKKTAVKLPKEVVDKFRKGRGSPVEEIDKVLILELYKKQDISSGKAAEYLGVSRRDFLDLLYREGIPYFDESVEDLKEETNIEI